MNKYIKLSCILLVTLFCSCGKKYLDLQQEKNQRVPTSLDDYQKLLDQTGVINQNCPVMFANIGADEYWIPASQYYLTTGSLPAANQINAYIWADQIYVGKEVQIDWNFGYNAIYLTNLGLEYINKTPRTDSSGAKWDRLKGSALFIRAFDFYNLAQLFSPVYSADNANLPLGISLRETSDPTVHVPRSTVGETYQKIVSDLNEALPLLNNQGANTFQAGKSAAYALLSRVYMQTGDYVSAEKAADSCLKIQPGLLDFNTLTIPTVATSPTFSAYMFGANNPEMIYMANPYLTQLFSWYHADTTLLRSYEPDDIRLKAYFSDTTTSASANAIAFRGSYVGNSMTTYFCGLATDEIYLNRAECRARNQNTQGALDDLNLLRKARFTTGTYVPLQSTDVNQVMQWVLAERRKELVMRGTRWADLRRLNKETKYAATLVRVLNDQRYELAPGSPKWVWPLPIEAISNGGYTQNPR